MKRILVIILAMFSFVSCIELETCDTYAYFIEWESWKTGLHSDVFRGGINSKPKQLVINRGSTIEYRLMLDSRVIDSFTTIYPNHVKNNEQAFYIKHFYRVH